MYALGHVTNNEQAQALYDKYGIHYKVMKRSGEVRAEVSAKGNPFRYDVCRIMEQLGAKVLLDHIDVCVSDKGFVFIASPYDGMVTKDLADAMRSYGYRIESTGFRLYMMAEAIVVRKE